MYNLSVCRICLGSELRMKVVQNTELHIIYDKLFVNKLQTEDSRPTQVCYLCYTQLRKCHELIRKAVKSDELLTQILNTGLELTENSLKGIDRQHNKLTDNLGISCMEFTNVLKHDVHQADTTIEEVVIKEEVTIKQESKDDFEEDNMNMTEVECKDTSDPLLEECEMVNNQSYNQSHFKYDIPLTNSYSAIDQIVKLEVEVEFENGTDSEIGKLFGKDFKTNGHEIISRVQQEKESLNRATSLEAYENHKKNMKDVGKTYSCTLCEYKSTTTGNLKVHIRTHTGEKPYSCTLCGFRSAKKANITTHMRKHTGEKPYSCTLCEYKCSRTGTLKLHMRTHTREKPFSCTLCEYKGSVSGHLKAHMRTHTGEKPFSCTQCDYKCSVRGNLMKHVKIHSKET